ncbi:MAG: AAA family ATPase, partial [Bdellovibrionales bacterium]|nr:AAA family ATPase [Bdellovibrionales bacterium]
MRVTRLEVFGFKSFLDRLTLPLEAGITGVVGPNGCGKSNIIDALRWVLGETRAKNLRGSVSEDVIFSGTESLRPLGLAEVTITLRAAHEDFFADLVSPTSEVEAIVREAESEVELDLDRADVEDADDQQSETLERDAEGRPILRVVPKPDPAERKVDEVAEEGSTASLETDEDIGVSDSLAQRFSWLKSVSEVQVTRRLYRSGESEYFINRVGCRLKDVKELFRAVGLGARGYTIVAQGEVSRIVSAKPEEKRTILEEAAGVLGFRDKIASAKRRLKDTEINLSRLDDIVKEVTRQVNSLRRQAAKARNREELKSELRDIEKKLLFEKAILLSEDVTKTLEARQKSLEEEKAAETAVQAAQTQEEA